MVINKFPNREVYEKIKEKGSLGADDVNVLEDYPGLEWKGEYSSTATYVKGDIVYYENMLYVMVSASVIGAIPGIDNDWIDFAKRSVTSSDVTNALGFTPADSTKVLPLSGGTLTGNLTGKYITGTWLQATDAGHLATTPTKIPVFDDKGWIYYRTPAEILKDIGASSGYTLTEADKTEIAGKVVADGTEFTLSDFPTALKNPNALTFTGAVTGTYDGSEALTVNIPAGGSSGSGSDATARRRNESDWKGLINAINAVSGGTFRDKCVHFAVGTCGMSMADINAYRAAMTNGTPETLHWYQTITKNLTGCTISNAASQVDYGEAYTATIKPESGKTITSVVVKMGGADITATAYTANSGAINIAKVTGAVTITAAASAPSVTYTITRNLTNCASSNTANTIAEGAAYTTTLSPTGTYKKLGAITVTMGGVDISASAVSGSTITIAKVTGSIVIACAAVITNIIDTIGISANTRLSTSSGDNRTQSGYAAIGANKDAASLIHLKAGDTLRIKGVRLPASNDSYSAIAMHNTSGAFATSTYLHNGLTWNNLTFNNADGGVTITSGGEHYIRVSLICTDASAVVATINEAIE